MQYHKVKSVAKKVASKGQTLSDTILETMKTVSDVVGATLGPGGMPILIERQEINMPGIVTKDGVTVFRSLGFDDSIQHVVMEAARDAAVRTVNEAGDGPQPMWSKVLTPNGFEPMGSIRPGMKICGTNGTIQEVEGVYHKGQKEIYKVTFAEGRTVECSENHLWTVTTNYGKTKTLTTKEILKDFKCIQSDGSVKHKYFVPRVETEFAETPSDFPIDPYFVGVLLGDGSLTDSGSIELSLGTLKEHILRKIVLPEGMSLKVNFCPDKNCFRVKIVGETLTGQTIRNLIDTIGLRNANSHSKFIPKKYLFSSVEDRRALLQGLIDTDGHINSRGRFEFSTVSQRLMMDFVTLARSLGKSLHIETRTRKEGDGSYSKDPIYRVVELKGDRYGNKIVGVEATGQFTEMMCIKVSNEDNLYITDNFIVTHNTTTATVLAEAIVRFTHEYTKNNPTISSQKVVRKLERIFTESIEPKIKELAVDKRKLKVFSEMSLEDAWRNVLKGVAKVSANGDDKLADAVLECFDLVGDEGNVTIMECSGPSSYKVERIKGFPIAMGYEDSCARFMNEFVNDPANQRVLLDKPNFILYHGVITETTTLLVLLQRYAMAYGNEDPNYQGEPLSPNLVIIATGFSESVLAWMAMNFKSPETINVVPLLCPKTPMKNSEFHFLCDVSAITGATILDPLNRPLDQPDKSPLDEILGKADSFEMFRFRSNIIGRNPSETGEELLLEWSEQVKGQIAAAESELDSMLLQERYGKLTGGIAKLIVSGASNGELKEKRDRAEDAVCAVRGAIKHGVLPGGGWTLIRLVQNFKEAAKGSNGQSLAEAEKNLDPVIRDILIPALLTPIYRIFENVGLNEEESVSIVLKLMNNSDNPQAAIVYDAMDNEYVLAFVVGLLDSTPAVLEAIRNSISIASLIGTLGGVVVFKRDAELERQEASDTAEFLRQANVNEANTRA